MQLEAQIVMVFISSSGSIFYRIEKELSEFHGKAGLLKKKHWINEKTVYISSYHIFLLLNIASYILRR